jgi:hypothetical protein
VTSRPKPQTLIVQLQLSVPRSESETTQADTRDAVIRGIETLIPDWQKGWGIYLDSIQSKLEG